jgi:hypothetical protein
MSQRKVYGLVVKFKGIWMNIVNVYTGQTCCNVLRSRLISISITTIESELMKLHLK